jgi:hypothetical protein
VAGAGRRRRCDLARATRVSVVQYRLETSTRHVAPDLGRMKRFCLRRAKNLIPSSCDRSRIAPHRSCRRARDDPRRTRRSDRSRRGCGACRRRELEQWRVDCEPEAADREAAARALREPFGTQGAAARSDGARARRPGGRRDRGRDCGGAGGSAGAQRAIVRAQAAGAQAVPGPPAAGAGRDPGAGMLPGLRVGAAFQARGGRDRDTGGDPSPLEGDPDDPGEVLLPGVRDDHPAAGALPCHAPGASPVPICWR